MAGDVQAFGQRSPERFRVRTRGRSPRIGGLPHARRSSASAGRGRSGLSGGGGRSRDGGQARPTGHGPHPCARPARPSPVPRHRPPERERVRRRRGTRRQRHGLPGRKPHQRGRRVRTAHRRPAPSGTARGSQPVGTRQHRGHDPLVGPVAAATIPPLMTGLCLHVMTAPTPPPGTRSWPSSAMPCPGRSDRAARSTTPAPGTAGVARRLPEPAQLCPSSPSSSSPTASGSQRSGPWAATGQEAHLVLLRCGRVPTTTVARSLSSSRRASLSRCRAAMATAATWSCLSRRVHCWVFAVSFLRRPGMVVSRCASRGVVFPC